MTTVYISIGNSDDKLTQREWSRFVADVESELPIGGWVQWHGRWLSRADDPYQNACWCIEIDPSVSAKFIAGRKEVLAQLAVQYRQDSIAWAEVTSTDFLGGAS